MSGVAGRVSRRDVLLGSFDRSSAGTLCAGRDTVRLAGFGALGAADLQGGIALDGEGTAFEGSGPFDSGRNEAWNFGFCLFGDVAVAPVRLPAGIQLILTARGACGLIRRRCAGPLDRVGTPEGDLFPVRRVWSIPSAPISRYRSDMRASRRHPIVIHTR